MKAKSVVAVVCMMILLWTAYPADAYADREIINEYYDNSNVTINEYHEGPSAADLDAIHADIRYPRKESFYLDDYKYATVSRNSVLAFKDPNAADVMAGSNTYSVYKDEEVVILAESQGYACVIFPNLGRAGWINQDYLAYKTTFADSTDYSSQNTEANQLIGRIAIFGEYEQDYNLVNGKEPIEWIILDVQEDRCLLISRYALDAKRYNSEIEDVTWATCTLRSWLNSTFLNDAFNSEQQKDILESKIDNSSRQG